ncbi:MAG: glycosyltransferase family 9 protein [Candidatus Hydrogenedentes bacterium]|nr:glycosyltransferase family 9 protein [Candidatus Hydrogenedentota bacterium]
MRILVVQATRMGDVLQTSPLLRMIRRKHPDAHLAVLVRKMGVTIAERHPDVDEVIVYDEDVMFLHLRSQDSLRLMKAWQAADAYIGELRAKRFDLAYNLTHSLASSMLLKLAEIPEVIGAHLSDDWQYVLRGPWTTYFFTSVFHREYNDLNLCDITRKFAADAPDCRELVLDVREADHEFAAELLRRHGAKDDAFIVCMQLGASEENKRWAPEHFAALAKRLQAQHNARIFLVGVKEEAPLGKVFDEHAPGLAVSLYGHTTIPQLAALLQRARLLVTNDTGTMHIAAAVKCPITLVSVGNVHYRETGPYGEGHVAVEWRRAKLGTGHHVPTGLEERTLLQPDHVQQAVEFTLAAARGDALEPVEEKPEHTNVDVFQTAFAPDGFLEYYPLVKRPLTERDLLRMAYRAMWLHHLEKQHDAQAERASLEKMLRHYTAPPAETIAAWRKDLSQHFGALAALAQRGSRTTDNLLDVLQKKKNMAKAKDLVAQLMRLDEEARIFSELHPPCKPLILIAKYERDNLEGADPINLAQTTLAIYRNFFQRARLTQQKIELITGMLG